MDADTSATHESEHNFSYAGYHACGGRINENDYVRVMQEAEQYSFNAFDAGQTKMTADISGVSLEDIASKVGIDPRTIYGILRHDVAPKGTAHHHSQMSDQHLLVEALRMLEQAEAVEAIISKHPHMSFD